ncbi:UNVERIFIED_CONTAM: hypothetical protein K2H54_034355, partial [Gekko kuhli]
MSWEVVAWARLVLLRSAASLCETSPHTFQLDLFFNNVSKPSAPVFDRLGSLEYDENSSIIFRPNAKPTALKRTPKLADGEKEDQFNGSPPRPQPRGPRTPPGPPPPDDDEDEPMPVS